MEQRGLFECRVLVSEMAVLRALQVAGNRVVGKRGRSVRGPMNFVEPWSIHVHLSVEESELDALLKDAWRIPVAVGFSGDLVDALDKHTRILLMTGTEFTRGDLVMTLSRLPQESLCPGTATSHEEGENVV